MTLPNGHHNGWPPSATVSMAAARVFGDSADGGHRVVDPMDHSITLLPDATDAELDARRANFADLYRRSEQRIAHLFNDDGTYNYLNIQAWKPPQHAPTPILPPTSDHEPIREPPRKRAKRTITDDYDDYDDEEDEHDTRASPLKGKNAQAASSLLSPSKSGSSPVQSVTTPPKPPDKPAADSFPNRDKTSEDARKQLEEARNATEEVARRSFFTIFHTLENDRTAMLEQHKLEEAERQLQAEIEKNGGPAAAPAAAGPNQGTLSSANLGASSLTLKHLIARIDSRRDTVKASDSELRALMNEVRKNRSKWASEDSVNQEELYEALEKVLTELKAHTEYSTPFLQRVNRREAPDYYIRKLHHPLHMMRVLCAFPRI